MATPAGTQITLTAAKLEPLVREETANCTQLGVQLNISLPRLQVLEKQSKEKKPIEDCFTEMCDYWLHKQPKENKDRKWSEVYEALEQQGNRRLKAKLEKKYVADTTVQLNLSDFTNELRNMSPKWYMFGCALEVPTTKLDIIEDKAGSNRYMIAMLQEWMDNKGEKATWEALQEALRNIGNSRLAAKLEEYKLKDKQKSTFKKQSTQTDDDGTSSYAQSGPLLLGIVDPMVKIKSKSKIETYSSLAEVSQAESIPTYDIKPEKKYGRNNRYTCQVFYKAYDKRNKYKVKLIFGFSKYNLRRNVARYFSDKIRAPIPKDDFDFDSLTVKISVSSEPQGWSIKMNKW